MFVNKISVEISWGDCDTAGIVYYPQYFRMFDSCTAAIFRMVTGIDKRAMIERYGIVGFPMVDTGARFYIPSRFGEEIQVHTSVPKIGRSSFEVSHRVFRGEDLAIEAFEKRVWSAIDQESGRLRGIPLPPEIVSALSTPSIHEGVSS